MPKVLSKPSYQIAAIATVVLFFFSSLRHILFKSGAYDLGIFDQAVYLISQKEVPISSLMGFHILGDHAAWILYLLAIPYKIYPSVYWLLFIQSLALSIAVLPLWQLSKLNGLSERQCITIALIYLLYPAIFNINLFDFHPDVLALPLLFTAVLTAKKNNNLGFILSILFILGCKEIFSLTVIALGLWLLLIEKKRSYGFLAIISGLIWFMIATGIIIPFYSHGEAAAVHRYSFLGSSVSQVSSNIIFKPWLVLGHILAKENLEYLVFLILPVIWAFSFKSIYYLLPAVPALVLNLITDYQPQKDLTHHYSLVILPFLMLMVIAAVVYGKGKYARIWSLIFFLIFAKYLYFTGNYINNLDTWQATTESISRIKDNGSVLTWPEIVAHLSQRKEIYMALDESKLDNLEKFDHILLNQRHPGWLSSPEKISNLITKVQKDPNFQLDYQKDGVFLFNRK